MFFKMLTQKQRFSTCLIREGQFGLVFFPPLVKSLIFSPEPRNQSTKHIQTLMATFGYIYFILQFICGDKGKFCSELTVLVCFLSYLAFRCFYIFVVLTFCFF